MKESRDAMRGITLDDGESEVFARAALALKYDDPDKENNPIEALIEQVEKIKASCVFRTNVTGDFGIVTEDSGPS